MAGVENIETALTSVEMDREDWFALLNPRTSAERHDAILELIQQQVGLQTPDRLGAVVLATVNSSTEHEVCIRARAATEGAMWYVPSFGIWVGDPELTHISDVLYRGTVL